MSTPESTTTTTTTATTIPGWESAVEEPDPNRDQPEFPVQPHPGFDASQQQPNPLGPILGPATVLGQPDANRVDVTTTLGPISEPAVVVDDIPAQRVETTTTVAVTHVPSEAPILPSTGSDPIIAILGGAAILLGSLMMYLRSFTKHHVC